MLGIFSKKKICCGVDNRKQVIRKVSCCKKELPVLFLWYVRFLTFFCHLYYQSLGDCSFSCAIPAEEYYRCIRPSCFSNLLYKIIAYFRIVLWFSISKMFILNIIRNM